MKKRRFELKVVLVRPRNPLNIGAAARAMANFGLSELVVVKPYPPIWRETVSAVGAERLVLAAKKESSLEEAVADCHVVLGTTTGQRRRLQKPLVRLPVLASLLFREFGNKKGPLKIALLFGSEKTGLANRYLEQCHFLVTVPTSAECPSMNLSQAVAVCCYELTRGATRPAAVIRNEEDANAAPTVGELERLSRHALEVFDAVRYLDFLRPADRLSKIRRTLLRWQVRRSDLALLHGILRFLTKAQAKR